MAKYRHRDGTVCRLTGDTWVVSKLSKACDPTERIGDPCPYCNKFPEDTAPMGRFTCWLYRTLAKLRIAFARLRYR